jgi:hypothetical protein
MKCSICQLEIPAVGDWTQGNSAEPVNDGRCCDQCNATVVIPARLTQMRQRVPKTHTPGPWCAYAPDEDSDGHWEVNDPYGRTATVYGNEEGAANARLIAAAPELLAALKLCKQAVKNYIDWGGGEDEDDQAYASAVAAISKAEGRGE